ncbi:MAG: hypothetical protein KKC76_11925 [Proteobacteria bacterium]|nr:hypothetical protein [Pseudomonadota bacterium]MBU4295992.1 hypothetical protein [Pseudomonadota bacterium]MCG2747243.1 hypothetical protein [Desulfobulbaceae bacterium]
MQIVLIILTVFIAILGWLKTDTTTKKFKVIAIFVLLIIGVIQFLLNRKVHEEKASKTYSGTLKTQDRGFYLNPKIKRLELGWTLEKRGMGFLFKNQITDIFTVADNPKVPYLRFFRDLSVDINEKTNNLLVSMILRDRSGSLIANLVNNEWKVAPPPKTFDRNYNDNTLEIISEKGEVILQVRILGDAVQLNGIFYSADGFGVEIFPAPPQAKEKGAVAGMHILGPDTPLDNILEPIFMYPSENHIGELRVRSNK